MVTQQRQFPPLPEIGRPDAYYIHGINEAESKGDLYKRSAMKVGRYITLALNAHLSWEEKFRYFDHALRHHCVPPSLDDEVEAYYARLSELVRAHCGAEALRLASQEDDMYAARVALGQDRSLIEEDAEVFFGRILGGTGDHCPEHYNEVDWSQLKLIRDQWI